MSLSAGITFHGFGNFVIPLSNEFGWSRTTISTVISIGKLQSGIFGPLEGWAVDKFGPRRLMFIGIPILGLGYVLLSTINTLAAFYVVYLLLITLGSNLSMGMPIIASVANWFKKRRGLAFGLASSPCTTPVLAVLLAWVAKQGNPLNGTIFLGSFAIGQVVPLVVAGTFAASIPKLLSFRRIGKWIPPISGVVLLTVGLLSLLSIWI